MLISHGIYIYIYLIYMYKVRKVECVLAYVCVCENPQKSEVVDFIWYIYSHIPYICVKSAEG